MGIFDARERASRSSFDSFERKTGKMMAGMIIAQIVVVSAVIGAVIFVAGWAVGEYDEWKEHIMQPTPAAVEQTK